MPYLRPQTSETGAQKMGPKPNPRLLVIELAITGAEEEEGKLTYTR